jgi:hypothetical protein
MYALRLVSSIETPQPIDLAKVKKHLRFVPKDDDDYIIDLMLAAMAAAENATHRQILTATYELQLDRFPPFGQLYGQPSGLHDVWPLRGQPIRLPRPPWQSTTSLKYTDTNGTLQTWSSTNYTTAGAKEPAEIWPAFGKVWPVARMMPAAVLVEFKCGYGDSFASVPALMRAGMLLLIGHWYMNREAVVPGVMMELPLGVKNIFEQMSCGDDFADYDSLGAAGSAPMEAATYGRWY